MYRGFGCQWLSSLPDQYEHQPFGLALQGFSAGLGVPVVGAAAVVEAAGFRHLHLGDFPPKHIINSPIVV